MYAGSGQCNSPFPMATLSPSVIVRRRICLRGIVQGVGFRPFVFNLANRIGIRGFILNSSSGVTIEAEGQHSALDEFMRSLHHPPPLAHIEEVTSTDLDPMGNEGFEIRESLPANGDREFALVSPDVATCDDCLRDVSDPDNRRFAYPFTNCTNCGPRYTIIRNIPYDRPMTTMAGFRMCANCQAEYNDPTNRRFHAQPNACPVCGPTVVLAKSGTVFPANDAYESGQYAISVFQDVRRLLHEGAIVAVKGLGGSQLVCDASNEAAVRELRLRKKRSDKPFALMARDIGEVEKLCTLSDADRELLLSPQRPIVILNRREDATIPPDLAPGNNTLGVMLAYTPLHFLLFADRSAAPPEFTALVMTSGNISDEPIVISNEEAWRRLAPVADWFLFHNRDIYMRVDDSVARTFEGRPRALRRSRAYAPQPIDLGSDCGELLACGAELKNTFCLTKGRYAILSQHIGDLENYETLEFYKETLANLKKLFRVEPQAVAHDLHPLYMSSRFAAELRLPKIGVQHHHAHVASCMAENRIRDRVIGIAFDGTGYGTDSQIWGGEFLVAGFGNFERRAHFRYVPLPGGDAAVRQTWRPALSWLRASFGSELPIDLPIFQKVPPREIDFVSLMISRNINTILTSSCGRLFDAVASIIGLRHQVTFEGQAAIELEMACQPGIDDGYPFDIDSNEPAQVDMRAAIRAIVRDVQNSQPAGVIASRFHNTIATVIAEMCQRIRASEKLNRVCLSGGTFQNMYLLQRSVARLRKLGFEVFLHYAVPPNDGGISLGQAAIANEILKSGALSCA
ncbi:MAG: (NiFe) hydrogenase maturation protein HypF [Acidobacteriaceae bacterium]|nr:(NiFe) hydrogenase maturation protein HypF [Acidobacteriaceae bacterium]